MQECLIRCSFGNNSAAMRYRLLTIACTIPVGITIIKIAHFCFALVVAVILKIRAWRKDKFDIFAGMSGMLVLLLLVNKIVGLHSMCSQKGYNYRVKRMTASPRRCSISMTSN